MTSLKPFFNQHLVAIEIPLFPLAVNADILKYYQAICPHQFIASPQARNVPVKYYILVDYESLYSSGHTKNSDGDIISSDWICPVEKLFDEFNTSPANEYKVVYKFDPNCTKHNMQAIHL